MRATVEIFFNHDLDIQMIMIKILILYRKAQTK